MSTGRASRSEEHRVKYIPMLDGQEGQEWAGVSYAGFIEIDNAAESNIFYWLFRNPDQHRPLIIWLNGGPGCSSMDGLFIEVGPFKFDGDRLRVNNDGWHSLGHLLFVDQPVGTGMSFTKRGRLASSNEAVAAQFYLFLVGFLQRHDWLLKGSAMSETVDIYLAGESHAGQYIPAIVAHIFSQKFFLHQNRAVIIKIEGIALGNPWINPYYQYDVSDFAYGLGFISLGQRSRLKVNEEECRRLLNTKKYNQRVCISLINDVVEGTTRRGYRKILNYDSSKFTDSSQAFPPDHEKVESYMNRPDVRHALNADSAHHRFIECADPPFYALVHLEGESVASQLSDLLQTGLRTLVFAGVRDVVCNHIGIDKVLNNLEWDGSSLFSSAPSFVWAMRGEPVAYLTSHANLYSLKVLNAGHMVPLDQPQFSYQMIAWFLRGRHSDISSSVSSLGSVARSSSSSDSWTLSPFQDSNPTSSVSEISNEDLIGICGRTKQLNENLRELCIVDMIFWSSLSSQYPHLSLQNILLMEYNTFFQPNLINAGITSLPCSTSMQYLCLRFRGNTEAVLSFVQKVSNGTVPLRQTVLNRSVDSIKIFRVSDNDGFGTWLSPYSGCLLIAVLAFVAYFSFRTRLTSGSSKYVLNGAESKILID